MTVLTVEDILAYGGDDYIYIVYNLLLGRDPDTGGLENYRKLMSGRSGKLAILFAIWSSEECRERGLSIPEFDIALRRAQARKKGILRTFRRNPSWDKLELTASKLKLPLIDAEPRSAKLERVKSREDDRRIEQIDRLERVLRGFIADFPHELRSRLDEGFSEYLPSGPASERRILGKGSARYLFNLSTSYHWRSRPVGIVRVERELANYLRQFANVEFVCWDKNSRNLRAFGRTMVQSILSKDWEESSRNFSGHSIDFMAPVRISADDIYVSVGIDWDLSPVHDLLKFLKPMGAKSVFMCHDIVPILFPEYVVRESLSDEFKRQFIDMYYGASRICTPSASTKRDLQKFWGDAGVTGEGPPVDVITLSSYVAPGILPETVAHDTWRIHDTFLQGDYVLYVSSVEPRKNHRMLIHLWRELLEEHGDAFPNLLLVGGRGWGAGDLLDQLHHMAYHKQNRIMLLSGASDELLHHLYHNAKFCVFPSLYEGWGLAASEALAMGKVCVVSNNSSLEEATQSLMPRYDPLDFLGWKREMERLVFEPDYLSSLEEIISEKYVKRRWGDFAREFCMRILLGE